MELDREVLEALELPPEAIPLFLEHIKTFCDAHGGPTHYRELLELIERLRRAVP